MGFDQQTTEFHRTARFSFVPWLARMFGDGMMRVECSALPMGECGALTDETVEAIRVIANKACWKFLARDCGWKRLDAVESHDSESHSFRRLWDQSSGMPPLNFTCATPDLLLAVFNASRKGQTISEIAGLPNCLSASGDLLVHHLLFRRIRSNPKSFGLENDHHWNQWYVNPLNSLIDPIGYRRFDRKSVDWSRLFEADLVAWMPWIGSQISTGWQVDCESFWGCGLDDRLEWLRALTILVSDYAMVAERQGRFDLLNGLVDFLITHEQSMTGNLKQFEGLTQGVRLQARQQHARVWVDFLSLADSLETISCDCLARHPVERTGAEKCFLALWEAKEFGRTLDGLRAAAQQLTPSFG